MSTWPAEREKMLAQFDQFNAAFEKAVDEGRSERLRYRSPDGMVNLVVDGNGTVRSMEIEPGTLRGSHPERLAASIMASVNDARTAADKRLLRLVCENPEERS